MAQRTTADDTMTRTELATYFKRLATEFDEGGEIDVEVGNKIVTLNPPKAIDLSVDVVERSTMFRGNHETIQFELNWKPEQAEPEEPAEPAETSETPERSDPSERSEPTEPAKTSERPDVDRD